MIRDGGVARLNSFTIKGMELAIGVFSDGSILDISNSKIESCFSGIDASGRSIIQVTNTDFIFHEDNWTKLYPAISTFGDVIYSHNGGSIDNYETGINLLYNNNLSEIEDISIKNAGTAINLDESNANINNLNIIDNYYGIYALQDSIMNESININITNSNISNNEIGVKAERFQTKVAVSDTTISNNTKYGVQVQKQATVLIGENVDFSNNSNDVYSNVLSDIVSSLFVDILPYLGDGKGIMEDFRGRNLINDQELSKIDKGLAFLCLSEIKSVKKSLGKISDLIELRKLRKIAKLTDEKFISTAKFLLSNYGDEAYQYIEKYLDDFAKAFIDNGDIVIRLSQKYGDDAAALISKHGEEAVYLIDKYGEEAVKGLKESLDIVFGTGKAGEGFLYDLVVQGLKNQHGDDIIDTIDTVKMTQKYINTAEGRRFIDVFDPVNRVAHESKVGYASLTDFIKKQVLKDAELLKSKQAEEVMWHFFKSDTTDKVGASKQLLKFLKDNGIKYIIHE